MTGPGLHELDPRLVEQLRRAGDEWGPLGVALAAAQLTDPQALVARLSGERPDPRPAAARAMRDQHGPDHHPRHAFWHALADWLEEAYAWYEEGYGTCPEIEGTNYPDAVRAHEDASRNVAATYLAQSPTPATPEDLEGIKREQIAVTTPPSLDPLEDSRVLAAAGPSALSEGNPTARNIARKTLERADAWDRKHGIVRCTVLGDAQAADLARRQALRRAHAGMARSLAQMLTEAGDPVPEEILRLAADRA